MLCIDEQLDVQAVVAEKEAATAASPAVPGILRWIDETDRFVVPRRGDEDIAGIGVIEAVAVDVGVTNAAFEG